MLLSLSIGRISNAYLLPSTFVVGAQVERVKFPFFHQHYVEYVTKIMYFYAAAAK